MCMLAFLLCLFPSSQQKSLDSAKSSATDNTAYKLDKIGDKSLKSLKDLWNFAPRALAKAIIILIKLLWQFNL